MALTRVYCGLAASEPAGSPAGTDGWLTAAVVDDAGRLLDVCDIGDDPVGYAELGALLAERSGGAGGVAVATDSDEHQVTLLLAAAGRPLAIVDDETVGDYADRFADDESVDEIEAGPAERSAVGLARALQAGALTAGSQGAPRELMALKPVLSAHAAVAIGRHGTAVALREVLRELYPAALRAYPDPAEAIPLAILDALPEPGLLGATTANRGRDAAVAAELAQSGLADPETISNAITALRVAIAETPRRTGIGKGTTTAIAETIREAVAAVRACDAAIGALVGLLAEKASPVSTAPQISRIAPVTAPPAESTRFPARRGRTAPAPLAEAAPAPTLEPLGRTAARMAGQRTAPVRSQRPAAAAARAAAVSAPPSMPVSVPPPPPGITPILPHQSVTGAQVQVPMQVSMQPVPPAYQPPMPPQQPMSAPQMPMSAPPSTMPAYQAPAPGYAASMPPVAPPVTAPQGARPAAPMPPRPLAAQQIPAQPIAAQQMPSRPAPMPVEVLQQPMYQPPPVHQPPLAQPAPSTHQAPSTHHSPPPMPTMPPMPAWNDSSYGLPADFRMPSAYEPEPLAPNGHHNGHGANGHDANGQGTHGAEPDGYPLAAEIASPGTRETWPLNPPSYDDVAVNARVAPPYAPSAAAPEPAEHSIPRQRDGRVPPPWQSDDMALPPEPPALRLVEPEPAPITPALRLVGSESARSGSRAEALRPDFRMDYSRADHRSESRSDLSRSSEARGEEPRGGRPYAAMDRPHLAAEEEPDGDLLIFAQARSAWFVDPDEDALVEPPKWSESADFGWNAALRAETPEIGDETEVGLPRRVPQANLVPGSPLPPMVDHGLRIVRDPASMAAHTTGYFRGSRRGEEVRGYAVGGRPGRESGGGWDFSRDGWDSDQDSGYRSAAHR